MNILHKALASAAKKRAVAGDPYWDDVLWVINFSTGSYTDTKGHSTTLSSPGTVSAPNGLSVPSGSSVGFVRVDGLASIGTFDYVLECWFNSPSESFAYPYLLATSAYQDSSGIIVYFNTSGYPYVHTVAGDRIIDYTDFSAYITPGTPTHLAISRTSGFLRMYIGGTRIWEGYPSGYPINHTGTSHWIGGNPEAQGYSRGPTLTYQAARCTVGTNRGYIGGTIIPDEYPFLTN